MNHDLDTDMTEWCATLSAIVTVKYHRHLHRHFHLIYRPRDTHHVYIVQHKRTGIYVATVYVGNMDDGCVPLGEAETVRPVRSTEFYSCYHHLKPSERPTRTIGLETFWSSLMAAACSHLTRLEVQRKLPVVIPYSIGSDCHWSLITRAGGKLDRAVAFQAPGTDMGIRIVLHQVIFRTRWEAFVHRLKQYLKRTQ